MDYNGTDWEWSIFNKDQKPCYMWNQGDKFSLLYNLLKT